jgi:hypothetical protein
MTPKAEAEVIKLLQAIACGVGSILHELRQWRQAAPQVRAEHPVMRAPDAQQAPRVILVACCPMCGRPLER